MNIIINQITTRVMGRKRNVVILTLRRVRIIGQEFELEEDKYVVTKTVD